MVFGSFTGLIVAGGLGTRLGGIEKAHLRAGDVTIAERTVALLSRMTRRILVATPRPEAWAGLPVEVVGDDLPEAGPLGGIVSGLRAARTAHVLLAGGDQPLLDETRLRALARKALASGRPVIPRVAGRPEPLNAVHLATHAGRAAAALHAGERRAWGWLDPSEVEWVDLDEGAARSFRSVNTPEELAELSGRARPIAARPSSRSRR